jgi:hypothetical protein
MFASFFENFRLRLVARKYAMRLGRQLRADYAASAEYTPAQIKASANRAGLPLAYLHLGYAGFLSEDAFRALGLVGEAGDYRALRSLLQKYARGHAASAGFEPAPEVGGIGVNDAGHSHL